MNEINKLANKTASYTIPSFYNSYITSIETDTIYDVPYATYRQIVIDYFQYIRDEVIENSKEFKLPYRLGSISIVKHKPKHYNSKSLRIDYQETKKQNKLILLDNMHSDMYKYRLYWKKYEVLLTNKTKYQLVMTRANKRHLAQIIKNKIHDYLELP